MMEYFRYVDIDGDEVLLEINFQLLRIIAKATIYNWGGEVVSRNKIIGWWNAKSLNKFFKILRNNIGNMPLDIREEYFKFIQALENKNIIKR